MQPWIAFLAFSHVFDPSWSLTTGITWAVQFSTPSTAIQGINTVASTSGITCGFFAVQFQVQPSDRRMGVKNTIAPLSLVEYCKQ